MAQIMVIIGALLVGGSGVYQLIKGTPFKNKKTGKELSMKTTIVLSIVCIVMGLIGIAYGIAMSSGH